MCSCVERRILRGRCVTLDLFDLRHARFVWTRSNRRPTMQGGRVIDLSICRFGSGNEAQKIFQAATYSDSQPTDCCPNRIVTSAFFQAHGTNPPSKAIIEG